MTWVVGSNAQAVVSFSSCKFCCLKHTPPYLDGSSKQSLGIQENPYREAPVCYKKIRHLPAQLVIFIAAAFVTSTKLRKPRCCMKLHMPQLGNHATPCQLEEKSNLVLQAS